MVLDLSLLPPPEIIEALSFESIFATRKARLLSLATAEARPALEATLALESEPITILLQENAYNELILRQRINDAAHAVMLSYATGANLDQLAALLAVARLAGEPDSSLRARTQLSLEGISTAGPRLGYVFHALSASSEVKDVYVDSPLPGDVRIVVLAVPSAANPNGIAGNALLESVRAAASAENVRPLCDSVTAVAAGVISYAVAASLVCEPGPDTAVVLANAIAACQRYTEDQFKLGHDITVSGLHAALHQPGVTRVDLSSPAASISIAPDQAAICSSIGVTIGAIAL